MELQISFEGLDDLKKAFDLLPKQVAIRAASKAVRAGAKPILEAARANVPKDTGNLAKSLAIKVLNQKRDAMEVVALIGPRTKYRRVYNKKREQYNAKLVADGWYGFLVEYGTHNTKAQPWLRPAFDANKVAAQQAIVDTIGEAIQAEASKFYGKR